MQVTIDGYPATLNIPAGHHLLDAVILARIVPDNDPQDDSVVIGSTDHTGRIVRTAIIDAAYMADADDYSTAED